MVDTAGALALAELANEIERLSKEATPGPFVVTTNMDFWIEQANQPDDGGFYGVAHCGDVSWPKGQERQYEWEANARLFVELRNNAATIVATLRALPRLEAQAKIPSQELPIQALWASGPNGVMILTPSGVRALERTHVLTDKVEQLLNERDSALRALAEMREALEKAPIPAKYHGQRGFELERFLADYETFVRDKLAALARRAP